MALDIALTKRLYQEAGEAHKQAKAILGEYTDKDMPSEKLAEANQLLDQAQNKSERARTLEREAETEKQINEPAARRELFSVDGSAQIKVGGKLVDPELLEDVLAYQPFPHFIERDAASKAYRKAMLAYWRKGENRLSEAQRKDLSAGSAAAGGYLVQDTFLTELIVKMREVAAMRRIARVLPQVPSGSLIAPTEDSLFADATWTQEVSSASADTVAPFGRRSLTPKPLAKLVKVSNTFLRTPNFDAEAYIRDRMAYKFAVPQEAAFVNGDGVGQPLGILNTPSLPTYTTASSNLLFADDVINWLYSLPAAYARSARILCNRAFLRKVRTISKANTSGTDNGYIWQPGLSAGEPPRIVDVPYELSDQFDDGLDTNDAFEDNAVVAVVGDWSYYWIVDALGLSVVRLVELYAEANQVGYIGRLETDGGCILTEAFYSLKIKA